MSRKMSRFINADKLFSYLTDTDVLTKTELMEWIKCNSEDVLFMRRRKIHQIARSYLLINNVYEGRKTCEIQPSDNDYEVGDYIVYKVVQNSNSRHPIENETYVITHCERPVGLKEGYVALSIKKVEEQ